LCKLSPSFGATRATASTRGDTIATRRPASAQSCGNIDLVKVEVVALIERRDIDLEHGMDFLFQEAPQGRRDGAWESVCWDLVVSLLGCKHEHVFPRT
jgi:hypothetical protein